MSDVGVLVLVVDLLAVYRLTRFVSADLLGGRWLRWPATRWAYRRHGMEDDALGPPGPQLDDMVDADLHAGAWPGTGKGTGVDELPPPTAILLRCRWCAGVYAAAAVALARWGIPDVWQWAAYALALSCAGPLVARLED